VNRRHPGAKRVLLTDLPRAELVRAYRAADLFVFASRVEYSPLVLFEAAAAGTPFLSSPAGNAREIAEWTSGGWTYAAAGDGRGHLRVDPAVLARELEVRAAARAELERAGAEGRRRVLEEGFTWEAIVPRYEAILAGNDAALRRGEGAT
jgi:glycosyltransferase involved in cell wall biosynthesis